MKKQQGFTLIELMIVVAIIAILAAIALPAYQNYVAKSQVTTALADITGAKTGIEEALNRGVAPSLTTTDSGYVGVQSTTPRCASIALATFSTTSAEGTITCTIGNSSPKVNTKKVILTRDANGSWTCTSDADDKYKPQGCAAAAA
jgi:type IV pilus assembly protein PilA